MIPEYRGNGLKNDFMNTCKNCKHFKYQNSEYEEKGVSGTCNCEKFIMGYHNPPIQSDEVLVEDDEGWGFIVGEDFGCIHFKET